MPRATKSIFNPFPCIPFNMYTSWSLNVAKLRCSFGTCTGRSRSGRTAAGDAACTDNEVRWTFMLSVVFFIFPKSYGGAQKNCQFSILSLQPAWQWDRVTESIERCARWRDAPKLQRVIRVGQNQWGKSGGYPRFSNPHFFCTFFWTWANSNHKPEELGFNLRYLVVIITCAACLDGWFPLTPAPHLWTHLRVCVYNVTVPI